MFLSFEGIDGCGKTTQLELLRDWLIADAREVVATREPGGTRLAEAIREYLLHSRETVSPRAELLLFEASRAQHVAEIIRPALQRGATVLCDRFADSTMAYQGGGLGLDGDFIRAASDFATDTLQPDLTFWFDAPLEIAVQRRARDRLIDDRIEARGVEFQVRVRAAFCDLARHEPHRIAIIDATGTPDEVFERVLRRFESHEKSASETTKQ